jgi:hypothetical protein
MGFFGFFKSTPESNLLDASKYGKIEKIMLAFHEGAKVEAKDKVCIYIWIFIYVI